MAQDPYALLNTFGPSKLRQLCTAFDRVWTEIEPHTDAENRERIRDVIASAIMELAKKAKEDNPGQLEAFAARRARMALGALEKRWA